MAKGVQQRALTGVLGFVACTGSLCSLPSSSVAREWDLPLRATSQAVSAAADDLIIGDSGISGHGVKLACTPDGRFSQYQRIIKGLQIAAGTPRRCM